MAETLHITSGDIVGEKLIKGGIDGELLVWHDILYDGLRHSGWPDDQAIEKRASFLENTTGGGVSHQLAVETLTHQYDRLAAAQHDNKIILWFDGCLFDQTMLTHILSCLYTLNPPELELICINEYPSIERFNGLGQLSAEQLLALSDSRKKVREEQCKLAIRVDKAFARQDLNEFRELARLSDSPLPFMPAAVKRWLAEQPDPSTGLGKLETLIMQTLSEGSQSPWQVFKDVAANDIPPQYWGDITLWQKINGLADRVPPLVHINGPEKRLPQWPGEVALSDFTITAIPEYLSPKAGAQ